MHLFHHREAFESTPGKNEHEIISKQESQGKKKKFQKDFFRKNSRRDDYIDRENYQGNSRTCTYSIVFYYSYFSPQSSQERNEKNYDSYDYRLKLRTVKGKVDFKIALIFCLIIWTIKKGKVQEQNHTQVSFTTWAFSRTAFLMDFSENRFAVQENTVDSKSVLYTLFVDQKLYRWDIIFQPSIIPREIRRIKG